MIIFNMVSIFCLIIVMQTIVIIFKNIPTLKKKTKKMQQ